MSSDKIRETYRGYVGSTMDALLVIQAVLNRQLKLIPRRPLEKERPDLIKSGNVFVFIEEYSGIKRWTDGIAWSPLRILGRFLVYRELDRQSLNEKDDKKKKKRKVSVDLDSKIQTSYNLANTWNNDTGEGKSYVARDQGLIKKTMSIATNASEMNVDQENQKLTIHLICYYNADDVMNGFLQRPSDDDLKDLSISGDLWNAVKDTQLGGKVPIEDEAYYFLDTNYQLQNMSALKESDSVKNSSHDDRIPEPSAQLHYAVLQLQKFPPLSANAQGLHMLPIPIQPPSFMYNSHKEDNSPYHPYRVHPRRESTDGNHRSGTSIGATGSSDINYGGGPFGNNHGGLGSNYHTQPGPYYNSYMIPPQVKSYLYESGSSLQGMSHPMYLYPQPLENYYPGLQQQYPTHQALMQHPSYNYVVPSSDSSSHANVGSYSNQPKNSLATKSRAQSVGNQLMGNYAAYQVPGHSIHGNGHPNAGPQSSPNPMGQQSVPMIPGDDQMANSINPSNYAGSN